MSKSIGIDQSHAVMAALATNVDWDQLDSVRLQQIIKEPKKAGEQFTAFLKMGGKVIVGVPKVINIDRGVPFDPAAFIGQGWKIEEQDERSLALSEIDLTEVLLRTALKDEEKSITGKETLKRIKKDGDIRLDAGIFRTLWENKHLIPERWKEKTNGNTTFIFFDGTILQDPDGSRYTLYLYWSGGAWSWSYDWFDGGRNARDPSARLRK